MTRGRNHQNGKAGNETMQVSSRRDSDAMIVQEGYARARRNDDSTLEKRLKDNGRRKTTRRPRKWCTSNRCQERAATQILVATYTGVSDCLTVDLQGLTVVSCPFSLPSVSVLPAADSFISLLALSPMAFGVRLAESVVLCATPPESNRA